MIFVFWYSSVAQRTGRCWVQPCEGRKPSLTPSTAPQCTSSEKMLQLLRVLLQHQACAPVPASNTKPSEMCPRLRSEVAVHEHPSGKIQLEQLGQLDSVNEPDACFTLAHDSFRLYRSRAFMLDQTFLHSDTTSSCRPGLSRKAKALVGNNAARRILATP